MGGSDDEYAAADPVRIVRRLSSSEGDANIDMSPSSSNGGLPQVVYWQRRALAAEQALQMATAMMERMKWVSFLTVILGMFMSKLFME